MGISDWSADLCSSDLQARHPESNPEGRTTMFDLGDIAKLAGQVIGGMVGGPAGAMIGSMIGDMIGQAIEGQSLDLLGDSGLAEAAIDLFQGKYQRSEEHTSELQSLMRTSYSVFCLKKNNQ